MFIYLKISFFDYFLVFNLRIKGWFWLCVLSVILVGVFIIVIGALIFLVVYWFFGNGMVGIFW